MKQLLEKVYNKSQREFFEIIEDNLKSENKMFIVTANPETLMIGVNNPEFHDILKKGEVTITPDGIGVVKALSAIGRNVNERITGVDIAKKLLEEGNKNNKSVYLYGAKPEVLDALVAKLKKDYPNLIIAGARDGYNNDEDEVFKDT